MGTRLCWLHITIHMQNKSWKTRHMAVKQVTIFFMPKGTTECGANITVYGQSSHQNMLNIDIHI